MQIEPSLRASDDDREQVAERLRHATAEGRLAADELEERLQTLFSARTYRELDALLADLPAGRSPGRQRVRVAWWAVAVGAFTLMLAALGALAVARLHSATEVAVPGPGGGRQFRFPGPTVAGAHDGLIVAVSMVGAIVVLLVCGVLVWVLMKPRSPRTPPPLAGR